MLTEWALVLSLETYGHAMASSSSLNVQVEYSRQAFLGTFHVVVFVMSTRRSCYFGRQPFQLGALISGCVDFGEARGEI